MQVTLLEEGSCCDQTGCVTHSGTCVDEHANAVHRHTHVSIVFKVHAVVSKHVTVHKKTRSYFENWTGSNMLMSLQTVRVLCLMERHRPAGGAGRVKQAHLLQHKFESLDKHVCFGRFSPSFKN